MNPDVPDEPSALDHVLVVAPYRRDGEYLSRLFAEHEMTVDHCAEDQDLGACLAREPGVFVTTHEALTPARMAAVAKHLRAQPAWSELPIVVLLDRASPSNRIRAELEHAWPRSRQIYYQRPITPVELVSGVQAALLSRLRQRDVRDYIEREVELRRELNHRVKNILASVISIFDLTRRGATCIDALADDFSSRLNALAKVHSAMFQADGESITIADVVKLTFGPYRVLGESRIASSGPPLVLSRSAGTTLALCLHELTTNAIKYGALSGEHGRVTFRWEIRPGPTPELRIAWEESGGPPVAAPSRTGYGTRYIRAALASLFGKPPEIAFASEGLRCEASGPLSRVACNPTVPGTLSNDAGSNR
jgi:two-component sensor histidine kinase